MTTEKKLAKAKLIELNEDFSENQSGKVIDVQFNPDTLKVTYANQLAQPAAATQASPSGGPARGGAASQASGNGGLQFVGKGSTKLALTLWFDVTAMIENAVDDVRRLTKDVIHFMDAKPSREDPSKYIPPATRFSWGSFIFDGIVEGLDESIEFFSPEGKPLRASINLTIIQQKIMISTFSRDGKVDRKGARPFASAKQGESLQSMTAGSGKGNNWQGVALANGIEDPLRMKTGQFVDLHASVGAGGTISASIGLSGTSSTSSAISSPPTFSLGSVPTAPSLPKLGFN